MPLCVSVYMYLVDSGWGWGSWAGLDCPVGCFAERSGVVPLLLFFFFFCLVFAVSLCASVCVCFVVTCLGEGLASWLSFVVSDCEIVTFPLVFWVKCGT